MKIPFICARDMVVFPDSTNCMYLDRASTLNPPLGIAAFANSARDCAAARNALSFSRRSSFAVASCSFIILDELARHAQDRVAATLAAFRRPRCQRGACA